MWPDDPHLANTYTPREGAPPIGPVARFLSGLRHDDSHLSHLGDVIGQGRVARLQQTFLGRMRLRLDGRPQSGD
jgi:hypothetical protein